MNSGKSAHIIMQVHTLRTQGNHVLVMKSSTDTRDPDVIKSRALDTAIPAMMIHRETNLKEYVKSLLEFHPVDYIFVDEVSFLTTEHVNQLADIVDNLNIVVFGYGLMVDFKSTLFEGSKRMVELADSVRELKSPCVKCGRKATIHLRSVDYKYVFEGDSIQVGDIDTYESVCRKCYTKAKEETT